MRKYVFVEKFTDFSTTEQPIVKISTLQNFTSNLNLQGIDCTINDGHIKLTKNNQFTHAVYVTVVSGIGFNYAGFELQ
jgi:hypothetical protein